MAESGSLADRQVVITRAFKAPRQMVFEAWTHPEQLRLWWGPDRWDLPFCEIDLRPGGTWFYEMRGPDGMESWGKATYQEIIEAERLAYIDTFVSKDGVRLQGAPELHVEITFEDDADGTLVTMTTTFDTTDARDQVLAMGAMQGWNQTLNRLAAHLAAIAPDRDHRSETR
jgi:uncharacterized protein YndB with AHSA1/START domain